MKKNEALDLFLKSKKEIAEIRYVLPGSGEEVFLKPFTTKEQKSILKALEKEDQVLVGEAMDDLIRNCVVAPKNFNVNKLLSKDRECLLIKLRQESVKEEYDFNWRCKECKMQNTKKVNLCNLPFNSEIKEKLDLIKKEIKLNDFDVTLVVGVSTREDEKNILGHAKKFSGNNKQMSQTEILNAAYASVIKGMKVTTEKEYKDEDGTSHTRPEESVIPVPFDERIKILEAMSIDDKDLIKVYFKELEEYGYVLKLGSLTCKECGDSSEQEMDWMSFFIL